MSRRVSALLRIGTLPALVVVSLLVAWQLGYFELDRRQRLFESVQQLRVVRGVGVAFLFAYALAITVGLPMAVMTVLGGAIFGARVGALLAWTGSLMGTMVAHRLARTIARKPIQRLYGDHQLLRRLRERADVMTLLRLRVIPAAPFAVLAYIAGIVGVSLRRLLVGTAIGVLPSVVAYSYVGAALMASAVSVDDESTRALWIAAGVTVVMVVLSFIIGLRDRSGE